MNAQDVIEGLQSIVDESHVITREADLGFFSKDLFFEGRLPLAVVAPGSQDELVETIRICTGADVCILPRGGGLSYTAGYVLNGENRDAIVVDTRRLNGITSVNGENLTITAECGCTWEQIHQAVAAYGVRVPMCGPSTGRYSTLGGSLSNNCMFFGSARAGTSSDVVLGLEVVTADGRVIVTGSGAIENGKPFFRNNGPDLTGLFLNDGGSLGVKAAATLRLESVPAGLAFASFGFTTFETMIPAIQAVGRSGLAAECLAVGPIGSETGPTLHVVAEGWTQDIADQHLAILKGIVCETAVTQDPVVPQFIRDHMFGFVQSPLDAKGRLQIWTHGVFPLGDTLGAYESLQAVLDGHADAMRDLGIDATMSFACAGNAMMVEPVLFWTGAPSDLHLKGMSPVEPISDLGSSKTDNLVRQIRREIRDAMTQMGAAHMQYGRFYPYADTTKTETVSLLKDLKQRVDPGRHLNPGVLGL